MGLGEKAESKVICVALDHFDWDVEQTRKRAGGGNGYWICRDVGPTLQLIGVPRP